MQLEAKQPVQLTSSVLGYLNGLWGRGLTPGAPAAVGAPATPAQQGSNAASALGGDAFTAVSSETSFQTAQQGHSNSSASSSLLP